MSNPVEGFLRLSDVELLAAYADARRRFVERKFARDTQRARLEWLRAKAFAAGTGGVSERRSVIDASEVLARRGQDVREMTRDLDFIKVEGRHHRDDRAVARSSRGNRCKDRGADGKRGQQRMPMTGVVGISSPVSEH